MPRARPYNRRSRSAVAAILRTAAAGLLLAGCDEEVTVPVDTSLSGIYVGEVIDTRLGTIANGTLEISHSGTTVTGTFNAGRMGTLSGTINGSQLEGTLTFTDACPGTATTTADVSEGSRILGDYQVTDCEGLQTGSYNLIKQS